MFKKFLLILGKSNPTSEETELLQFILDLACDKIKNYCNINEIPKGLENTAVRIAADIWRSESYGNEEKTPEVTSVKRGDVSTSFSSVSSGGDSIFFSKYKAELNRFRKLRW